MHAYECVHVHMDVHTLVKRRVSSWVSKSHVILLC